MTVPIGPGIAVARAVAGGSPAPVTFFDGLISNAIAAHWPSQAASLEKHLVDFLGQGDLIAKGFTLYGIGALIDRKPVIAVARAGNGDLLITCTAGSCGIVASSTQPTIAGKWADPRVRVTFGLSFSFTIELPTTTGGALRVSPLRTLRVLRPDIDSMSLITDIAFFFDDVVAFFRGSRFVEDLQNAIAGKDFAHLVNGKFLDDALTPVNQKLAQLWNEGFPYLDVLVDTLDGLGEFTTLSMPGAPSDQLTLALIGRGVDRTGVIEGTIEWPREFGRTTKGPTLSMLTSAWAEASTFSLDTVSAMRVADAARVEPEPLIVPPEEQGTAATVVVREATSDVPITPLADKISTFALDARAVTLRSALEGSRTQLRAILGTSEISRQLREIMFGTDDLKIEALMELPGEPGTFTGGTRVVSTLAALWTDDDETTFRRHYRLTDVATDTSLRLQVSLGDGWRWTGKDFIATPEGWTGFVSVKPLGAGEQPSRKPRGSILRTAAKATLVNGISEVALNPQPLPPKDGDDVSLNPQPLPPKWSDLVKDVERFTRLAPEGTVGRRLGKVQKIGLTKGLDTEDFQIEAIKVTPDAFSLSTVITAVSPTIDTVSVLVDDSMRSAVGAALAAQGKDLGSVIKTGFDAKDDVDLSRLGGILNPERVSPTGAGVVYGIDFTLVPYVPPVVR